MTQTNFYWVTDQTKDFMSKDYLQGNQTVEGRVGDIAETAGRYLKEFMPNFADKFYDYMSRGFYSLSSPVWANFGTTRGLPISCNGSYVPDNIEGMYEKLGEVGVMTKNGAGTSFYVGDIRRRGASISSGGVADGPVHYLQLFEAALNITSQGQVRRGNGAAYLDADHPDFMEFLKIQEVGNPIQKLSIGASVSDQFLRDTLTTKGEVWAALLGKRFQSGYPYIFFTDNANRGKPQWYKDKGYHIYSSNLCSEIALPLSDSESFVCNLSSMNFATYDQWKHTDAVEVLTYFLDAVMEEYIQKTEGVRYMEAANKFAKNHRAIGIGTLGFHTYLQDKGETFGGFFSRYINKEVHKVIKEKSYQASQRMADHFGEPEVTKGYGMRNATTMAIAPTTSSSFILGQVSPSTEPLAANIFTKGLAKGSYVYMSPALERLLDTKGMNNQDVWDDITLNAGSVQHLTGLTQDEKDIFKTFEEISQLDVVTLAAERQPFIDQAQSVNLKIHPDTPLSSVNTLVLTAWKKGLKSLYYQRGINSVKETVRQELLSCTTCEA